MDTTSSPALCSPRKNPVHVLPLRSIPGYLSRCCSILWQRCGYLEAEAMPALTLDLFWPCRGSHQSSPAVGQETCRRCFVKYRRGMDITLCLFLMWYRNKCQCKYGGNCQHQCRGVATARMSMMGYVLLCFFPGYVRD